MAYRELRLEGLARHPDAFGASWEDEAARPLPWFAERLERNAVFGGWVAGGSELAGVAGLLVPEAAKLRHKGVLWGMYVRPRARRTGLAAALLEGARAAGLLCHPVHVAGDDRVLPVAPDDLAA